jgi:hypothetical protein
MVYFGRNGRALARSGALLAISSLLQGGFSRAAGQVAAASAVITYDSVTSVAMMADLSMTPAVAALVRKINVSSPILFAAGQPTKLAHARCGSPGNDRYNISDDRIILCDETSSWVRQSWVRLQHDLTTVGEIEDQALWFVAAHEMAHAIVARYSIPTPGDEEAAVDELGAILILVTHPLAVSGGKFFLRIAAIAEGDRGMSTHHGSSLQRSQRLACLGAGREHADMLERLRANRDSAVVLRAAQVLEDLAATELGSRARVVECWQYYPRALATWRRLLGPAWKL